MSFSARLCLRFWHAGMKHLSSINGSVAPLAVEFSDPKVQEHLRIVTGLDLEKVFQKRKQELDLPLYNLVTEKQLLKVSIGN